MIDRLSRGNDCSAITVRNSSGATLNIERDDDGQVSVWIAPPRGDDGHSVLLDGPDLTAVAAFLSDGDAFNAGVQAAANAIEAHAEAIDWYEGGGVWADAIEVARKAVKQ